MSQNTHQFSGLKYVSVFLCHFLGSDWYSWSNSLEKTLPFLLRGPSTSYSTKMVRKCPSDNKLMAFVSPYKVPIRFSAGLCGRRASLKKRCRGLKRVWSWESSSNGVDWLQKLKQFKNQIPTPTPQVWWNTCNAFDTARQSTTKRLLGSVLGLLCTQVCCKLDCFKFRDSEKTLQLRTWEGKRSSQILQFSISHHSWRHFQCCVGVSEMSPLTVSPFLLKCEKDAGAAESHSPDPPGGS